MSILVYIDHNNGTPKKSSLEAASYAAQIDADVTALVLGNAQHSALASLGACGVKKIWCVSKPEFNQFDAAAYTKVIAEAAKSLGASVIVCSHNSNGKAIAPRLSARLQAGLVTGATQLPRSEGGALVVRKSVFSGKAFADYSMATPIKIISLNPNSFPIGKTGGTATIEEFATQVGSSDFKVKVIETKKLSDKTPLPEAELVVSAGRGMKGPENWGIVEDLAEALGATTACSRPVADVGWRPHHEHVGQTGITIRPNLYIAIGISGAIQHLAGVNNSKVIVVINKDAEAPFFKVADYGIVGDAFEVLPKITEALKKFKAEH
jgi:electron transfer flavoprotein alpha subunit